MNLQQAIEIIDNIIAGVQCDRKNRGTIENAFMVIVNATKPKIITKPKPEKKKEE